MEHNFVSSNWVSIVDNIKCKFHQASPQHKLLVMSKQRLVATHRHTHTHTQTHTHSHTDTHTDTHTHTHTYTHIHTLKVYCTLFIFKTVYCKPEQMSRLVRSCFGQWISWPKGLYINNLIHGYLCWSIINYIL